VTREEIVRFHEATFLPWRATLIVAGALSHADLVAIAKQAFGDWTGEERVLNLPSAAADFVADVSTSPLLAVVPREAAAQSELRIGISLPVATRRIIQRCWS
jgi:predicted Zn-dependent peptidase